MELKWATTALVGITVLALATAGIGWQQASELREERDSARESHGDAAAEVDRLSRELSEQAARSDELEALVGLSVDTARTNASDIDQLNAERDQLIAERDEARDDADHLLREVQALESLLDERAAIPAEPVYLAPDPATVRAASRELLVGIGRAGSQIDDAELDHLVETYMTFHREAWEDGGDPDARFLVYFYEDAYAGEIATREQSEQAQRQGELFREGMDGMRDAIRNP